MTAEPIDCLRQICLALPEAVEQETWEQPTFRVLTKIFVIAQTTPEARFCCKAPPGAQAVLIGADPARFYRPAYVGHKGWIGMRLTDDTDWDEVAALVGRSYRMTAPKRLASLMP